MRARVRLLPCDRPTDRGDTFVSGGVQIENKQVPVWLEDESSPIGLIGKARVWVEAGWVLAEMDVLDTRIPDPMSRILYPVPLIASQVRDGSLVSQIMISGIALTVTAPPWPMKTLAAQVAS